MLRRLGIPLTTVVIAVGSLLGLAGNASAAVVHHSTATAARPNPAALHGFTPGGLIHLPTGALHAPASGTGGATDVESTNWSGYAATGADGAFSSVSSSWTQPTASCTSRRGDTYAAFWVGLDGYSSDTVEQTGTLIECVGRTAYYYGWYEMYPAALTLYSNTVKPGDAMSASVTFSGTETYTLVLTDTTQDWSETFTANESGLDRSSAEVITEAPSSSSGVLPLADFGTVTYGASLVNGSSLAAASSLADITMVDNSGLDKDTTGSIASNGSFSNTWVRSS